MSHLTTSWSPPYFRIQECIEYSHVSNRLGVAGAGAVTPALPEAFATLTPLLPLTPALQGFRAITTDGPGVAGAVGMLVVWLLIGVSAAVLAVARRRMLPASAGAPRLAESLS